MIDIDKAGAEAGEGRAGGGEVGSSGGIGEDGVALVGVESVGFADKVGHEDVLIAVVIDIADGESHAGFRLAVIVDGRAHFKGDVDKTALGVEPELIGFTVVGDVDVDPAVVVEIAADDAESLTDSAGQAGGRGDIGERAIAVVVIEDIGDAGKHLRAAELLKAGGIGADLVGGDGDIVDDVDVEKAIAVVIDERRRARPVIVGDTGGFGDLGEGAIAVVAVEPVSVEVGEVDVEVAVVVEVAERDADAVALIAESGFTF